MDVALYSAILLAVVLILVSITDPRFKKRDTMFVSIVCISAPIIGLIERFTNLWISIAIMTLMLFWVISSRLKQGFAT